MPYLSIIQSTKPTQTTFYTYLPNTPRYRSCYYMQQYTTRKSIKPKRTLSNRKHLTH